MYAFLDIYYRTFTIAISPRGNDFKDIISKVPGGNSYCEGSIIDIQKRTRPALRHTISLQMAQTRLFPIISLPKLLTSVLPILEILIGDTRDQMEQIGNILLW